MAKTIGVVEIGTAKVAVLVGVVSGAERMEIVGAAMEPSQGIKKGEVVDLKAASEAVHAALQRAEQQSGRRLERVCLAQTGGHVRGSLSRGRVQVSAADNCVSQKDIRRAIEESRSKELDPNRVFIHHIRTPFLLDGRWVQEPLGMQGQWLEAVYWSVHAQASSVSDAIHGVNAYGVKVDEVLLSSIGSALAVTAPQERDQGVLVLDIGAGTTDYALYQEGFLRETGVLPVGGEHITNDLSLGLRISRKEAETLKRRHARACLEAAPGKVFADVSIGDRKLTRKGMDTIVHARVQELFSLLADRLKGVLTVKQLPAGVVLTGGTSLLPQIEVLAAETLGVTTRLGELPSWVSKELQSPEWATVLGLLYCVWTQGTGAREKGSGFWGQLGRFLVSLPNFS